MSVAASTMGRKAGSQKLSFIIAASSVGTLIEWYDFYLYGSLAVFFSTLFFPVGNPTVSFLISLATFATGFAVRPFGAIFFGRLGDLIGRKFTFMLTLGLMGGATFLVGCLPSYDSIGMLAPVLLVALRLLQGLALGGEYGGAATYIAEHAPDGKRGFYTSWIQTTATLGIVLSLLVILAFRLNMGDDAFRAVAHVEPEGQDDEQRQHDAERRRGLDPTGVETPLAVGRVLGDVGRGTAILAAQGQALQEAQGDQQDRRQHADRIVAWQAADQERRAAHQAERQHEGEFASDQIAQPAEEDRAERPH